MNDTKKLGTGKLVSLENDAEYHSITQKHIDNHKLEDIANVLYSPLRNYLLNNKNWRWYGFDKSILNNSIDMLIVDGPVGDTQRLARYPALPILYEKLADKAIIILDDGNRDDEKEISKIWVEEFNLKSEFYEFEKGAYLFKKIII